MTGHALTLEEIRRKGIEALARELGPVGMVRFLQQFETGHGDYGAERHRWLPDDLQAIAEELKDTPLPGSRPPG
ncbi:MAG: hypothetical protein AB1505_27325 [Candidatus Latescibacterota bacterium]